MSTPNLALTHIAASQNSKEVTANAAFDGLDEAMNSLSTIAAVDTSGGLILTAVQALSAAVFVFSGALTADRNVTVPINAKFYRVKNNTTGGHNLTVKTASGTGIAVAAADGYVTVYCDGTNVVRIT